MLAAFIFLSLPFLLSIVSLRSLTLHFADVLVMDGSHASSASASFSFFDTSFYSVMEYISPYGRYLDARRFCSKRIAGDRPSIDDFCFDKYRDTVVGAWITSWCHCGGWGARLSRCTLVSMDSHFVRCYKEVNNERWLSLIVSAHHITEGKWFPTSRPEVVSFPCPCNHLYVNSNWVLSTKEAHLKYWNRSGERCRYISNWHNLELFALPPSLRSEYYVWISSNWQDSIECCRVLMVLTPQFFRTNSTLLYGMTMVCQQFDILPSLSMWLFPYITC